MSTTQSLDSVTRLVTRLALVLALVVGLAPVAIYWTYSSLKITTQLEGSLKIQTLALTDFIAAQPETWDVATDRLLGSLDRYVSHEKGFSVYDQKGAVVVQALPTIKGPFVTRSHTIYSFGQPVGRMESQESILGELLIGLLVLAGSLVCAWLVWGAHPPPAPGRPAPERGIQPHHHRVPAGLPEGGGRAGAVDVHEQGRL